MHTMRFMIYRMIFPITSDSVYSVQIRRAALSVPSNIAEGYGRRHRNEYLHHLYISRGSLMVTETQLIAAVRRLMYSRDHAKEPWEQLQHTGRLLNKLISSLESSP